MATITAYSFGRMEINGKIYTSDLIIYPAGPIKASWWRRQGHSLSALDIMELIDSGPEIIVVGTGASGLMKPENDLQDLLTVKGIELIFLPTAEATTKYNELATSQWVGACFHLTC